MLLSLAVAGVAQAATPRDRFKRLSFTDQKSLPNPPKDPFGQLPEGPMQIVISINKQQLTLYSNGVAVGHAPVSTGTKTHPTPTGIFSVIEKQKWHRSNIYSGAPMPYMQRLTWSGVALHAGVLPGYPASHGCIRMPDEFALRLFGATRLGTRVIVTRGELAPTEFVHPLLSALLQKPAAPPLALSEPGLGLRPTLVNDRSVKLAELDSAHASGGRASDATEPSARPADPTAPAAVEPLTTTEGGVPPDPAGPSAAGVLVPEAPPAAAPAEAAAPNPSEPAETPVEPTGPNSAEPPAGHPTEAAAPTPSVTPASGANNDAPSVQLLQVGEPVPLPVPAPRAGVLGRRKGPVALFISRKEKKLYVRQGFQPLFELPISIVEPDKPLGTHVFTAMEFVRGGRDMRWTAISLPGDPPREIRPAKEKAATKTTVRRAHAPAAAIPADPPPPQTASQALARVELPAEAVERIGNLLVPGSSLIISDLGLGYETGKGTDFIVVTR